MAVRMVGSSAGIMRRWWLCLWVVWATRCVAAGGSGSLPVDGVGDAQIRSWRPALDGVALGALLAWVSCRAKALRFGADVGDTRGCRSPLEDDVVVLLSVPEFRMKTFVRLGLDSGDA